MKLRELVLGGHFSPGERISELGAVELLEMSRTPVRLALASLAHEGLLEPREAGGFVVRRFTIGDVLDAIELRGTLEGSAARKAARLSKGKSSVEKLRAIYDKIEEALKSKNKAKLHEQYVEQNANFHNEMLRLAQSPTLERMLAHATALPFASPNAFVRLRMDNETDDGVLIIAQHHHLALIEAIEDGDGDRAFALGEEHARLAARQLKSAAESKAPASEIPGNPLIDYEAE